MNVYLDMDGVLVDFVGGLHRALEMPYTKGGYPYEATKYDIFDDIVKAKGPPFKLNDLYRTCDGREFWANLPWDVHGKEIYKIVLDAKKRYHRINLFICTKPAARGDAWAGKVDWVIKNLPELKNGLIIMDCPKSLLARDEAFLIDDKDENVEDFRINGGQAFLTPQPWNSQRNIFTDHCSWLDRLEKEISTHYAYHKGMWK